LERIRKEQESIKKELHVALNRKAVQEKQLKEEEKIKLKEKRLRGNTYIYIIFYYYYYCLLNTQGVSNIQFSTVTSIFPEF
jgi:hypothetical protein